MDYCEDQRSGFLGIGGFCDFIAASEGPRIDPSPAKQPARPPSAKTGRADEAGPAPQGHRDQTLVADRTHKIAFYRCRTGDRRYLSKSTGSPNITRCPSAIVIEIAPRKSRAGNGAFWGRGHVQCRWKILWNERLNTNAALHDLDQSRALRGVAGDAELVGGSVRPVDHPFRSLGYYRAQKLA
jgi:hypothetical protein